MLHCYLFCRRLDVANRHSALNSTLIPKMLDQVESMVVTGSTPGVSYYFAVRVLDEELNMGGLGNSPSAVVERAKDTLLNDKMKGAQASGGAVDMDATQILP